MAHGPLGATRTRLRTYAVNIADAHPARLPDDVMVAAEGARKAIERAAPILGVPPHRCFAIPVRTQQEDVLGMGSASAEEAAAPG